MLCVSVKRYVHIFDIRMIVSKPKTKTVHCIHMHFSSVCILLMHYSLNLFRFRGSKLLQNNDSKKSP